MPNQVPKKDTVLRVSQKSLIAENTRLILMDKKERNESGSKRAAIEGTNSAFKRAHGAEEKPPHITLILPFSMDILDIERRSIHP